MINNISDLQTGKMRHLKEIFRICSSFMIVNRVTFSFKWLKFQRSIVSFLFFIATRVIYNSVKGNNKKRGREERKQNSERLSQFSLLRMLSARGVIFLKGDAFTKSHLRTVKTIL